MLNDILLHALRVLLRGNLLRWWYWHTKHWGILAFRISHVRGKHGVED